MSVKNHKLNWPHHTGQAPPELKIASQGGNPLRNTDFFKIQIEHLPTGREVKFEGWVTQFSDNFTSQWNEEMVYGRMDPLSVFQSTRRSITLGFDVVNDSKQLALENMARVRSLIQFLYPTYEGGSLTQQNVLKAGPLLGLKWTNLISSPTNAGDKLIGYINGGLGYSPEMGEGGYLAGPLRGADKESPSPTSVRNYFPKKLSLNFTFTVLHTHLVGWAPLDNGDPQLASTQFVFGNSGRTQDSYPNAYLEPPAEPAPAPVATPPPREGDVSQTTEGAGENLDSVDNTGPDEPAQSSTMNGERTQEELNEAAQKSADLRAAAEEEMTEGMGGAEAADYVTGDMEGSAEGENIDWGGTGPGSSGPPAIPS